jgi:dipeptidyl aminopeptidase/acylaminoacyl peptidase
LAYTDGRDTGGGKGNIYIINADGSNLVKLRNAADFGSVDQNPAWSPDGAKIAWSLQNQIYVTNADNTGVAQQLTSSPEDKDVGDYSPDGTKIAYVCYQPGNPGDLCVVNANGSDGETNITNSPLIGEGGGVAWQLKPAPSDTTKPTLNLPSDITKEATGSDGAQVTYNVTATDENPANPDVNCSRSSGSIFPIGTTQVNCSATDAAGNEATSSFNVTVRDTTAPTISGIPADFTKTTTNSSGAVVSYASPTASDAVDGGVTVNCSPSSGSTFALGETTVSCSVSDTRANTITKTFKVSVLYDFGNGSGGGFAEPVANGALNQVKAGAGVPVKFGLGSNLGLDIFATGYPTFRKITCDAQQVMDPIEETVAVSNSGLKYDSASGHYIYSWKTDKAWSNTCRQLVIKLKDGSEHPINFRFK